MIKIRSTEAIGISRVESKLAVVEPWLMRSDVVKAAPICEFPKFDVKPLLARKKPRDSAARTAAKLRRSAFELAQSNAQLARLASELIVAEQRERSKIAQLLHDDLQQMLFAAKIALALLARKVADVNDDSINRVQAIVDGAIQSARNITMDLSPPIHAELSLSASLRRLACRMGEQHGLDVDLEIDPAAEIGREDLRILLVQAARELLFNVVKHSGVQRARLQLRIHDSGRIALIVSDKGAGCEPAAINSAPAAAATGFGLPAIRERLTLLGGRIKAWSAPGRGSRFSLSFPPEKIAS